MAGCEDDNCIFNPVPAAPQGVFSITGDGAVYLYWYGPYEADIVEFIIWRSDEPVHNYREIGRRPAEHNPELDLWQYEYIDETAQNSVTYYYAVSSVDQAGQVSELSAEEVKDTPRPEGQVFLFDAAIESSLSGYHFADSSTVDSSESDVYVDRFNGVFYLNARNDYTDLQDMGYTESFDDIGWAPQDGWSELGWLEIIQGHTYVIWTDDLHFAKMRVETINPNSVTFRWAYQTAPDNPELAPRSDGLEKPVHGPEYLRKDNKSTTLK
ncbi:MAG: hypothetical protein E3J26_01430 [Candidatus Zixiibacteriota bacterium]|nr:MAG: hypothetical protein E3J26_01430 [candidate division Zixibacteria bacterium]